MNIQEARKLAGLPLEEAKADSPALTSKFAEIMDGMKVSSDDREMVRECMKQSYNMGHRDGKNSK